MLIITVARTVWEPFCWIFIHIQSPRHRQRWTASFRTAVIRPRMNCRIWNHCLQTTNSSSWEPMWRRCRYPTRCPCSATTAKRWLSRRWKTHTKTDSAFILAVASPLAMLLRHPVPAGIAWTRLRIVCAAYFQIFRWKSIVDPSIDIIVRCNAIFSWRGRHVYGTWNILYVIQSCRWQCNARNAMPTYKKVAHATKWVIVESNGVIVAAGKRCPMRRCCSIISESVAPVTKVGNIGKIVAQPSIDVSSTSVTTKPANVPANDINLVLRKKTLCIARAGLPSFWNRLLPNWRNG